MRAPANPTAAEVRAESHGLQRVADADDGQVSDGAGAGAVAGDGVQAGEPCADMGADTSTLSVPGGNHGTPLPATALAPDGAAADLASVPERSGEPEKEADYGDRNVKALEIERGHFDCHMDRYREDTPIVAVNRTDTDRLFNLKRKRFPLQFAITLGAFMNRRKESKWTRDQEGYLEKAALAISSRSDKFSGIRYGRCRPGRLCGEVDFCPRCHLESRVRPALAEYGAVFEKAPHWFAAVPPATCIAAKAGLHYVTRKDEKGRTKEYRHLRPYGNQSNLPGLTLDNSDAVLVEQICRVPFLFAKLLVKSGLADGAYATRELYVEFLPTEGLRLPGDLLVREEVVPHGNILFNTRHKPIWRFVLDCWSIYREVVQRLGLADLIYDDLLVGQAMTGQAEVNRWLGYSLKPMQFEKFYLQGIDNGCRIDHLNLHFDQTIFGGIKTVFGDVRSPRKFGNLFCLSRKPPYIGTQPPNRKKERIQRKLARAKGGDAFEILTSDELEFLMMGDSQGKPFHQGDLDSTEDEY